MSERTVVDVTVDGRWLRIGRHAVQASILDDPPMLRTWLDSLDLPPAVRAVAEEELARLASG